MRSLMLAMGACLFALNFAGCSSTSPCGGSCGQGILGGGNVIGNIGSSGGGESSCGCGQTSSCGDQSCSGDCGNSSSANAFANKNYGGQTGLGLGLSEAGPSCKSEGCNGGCRTCKLKRPQLADRVASRLQSNVGNIGRGCGCKSAGGCDGAAEIDTAGDCGCGTPAPTMLGTDCGCSASGPVEFSMGDSVEHGFEGAAQGSGLQLASHNDRRGLLRGFSFGRSSRTHQSGGCGTRGCGGPGGLCSSCRARLQASRTALGVGPGAGSIPHRDPTIHGGGQAGPAGQIPTYAYPYYTTRAPRDFLDPNPPTIGY